MQVAGAVSEDALYLLIAEFEKGLEDATRRPGTAVVVTHFCSSSKLDYQEHVPSLLTVSLSPRGFIELDFAGLELMCSMPSASH